MTKLKSSVQNFPATAGFRLALIAWRKKFLFLIFIFAFCLFNFRLTCFAQDSDLEFSLDAASSTVPLPKIFKPNIDLSGRGFHQDATWPQTIAAKEVLDIWQKDIGFNGLYRLQYNLWEIYQLSGDPEAKTKLLGNYEGIIKGISDAGGTVILDLFGTPAGLGKVLDKKSPPRDLKVFKELIKNTIRELSCNKRYNIWYEVWSAPDLDDFFLGRIQEYLNLYKVVAESVNELKAETKIYIPVGGPSVSWWFQNLDGNAITTAEKSLIYELIKFCYHYRLPLDFITWHSFSANPQAEKENTIYKKSGVNLVRDWLSYFNFDRDMPLVVDEWNYDRDANVLPEREEKSFISASYIPSRIKNMYQAGISYQLYFCLEDFQNNKEAVVRNVGIFYYDAKSSEYKGGAKATYNVLRMLANLGSELFISKFQDEFVGVIAAKNQEDIHMLIYNYIDPDIVMNFLSNNVANLKAAERRVLLDIVRSDRLRKILLRQMDLQTLRTTNRVKQLLKKAQELNDRAKQAEIDARNIKINIKNLEGDYLYQRYAIDSSCSLDCEFTPAEQKEFTLAQEPYQETLALKPYSVYLIILKKQPKIPPQPEADIAKPQEESSPSAKPEEEKEDTAHQKE
jgi:hypothetical protein